MKKNHFAVLAGLVVLGGLFLPGRRNALGQLRSAGQDAREQVRAPGLPDLRVALEVNTSACWVEVGQDISCAIQVTVGNMGQAAVSQYSVALVLSKSPLNPQYSLSEPVHPSYRVIGKKDIRAALRPRETAKISLSPVKLPDSIVYGNYYIIAVVDPDKRIQESDEHNNTAQTAVWIKAYTSDSTQWYDGQGPLWVFTGKGFGSWKSSHAAKAGPYTIPISASGWTNTQVKMYAGGIVPVGAQMYDVGIFDGDKAVCRTHPERWGIILTSGNPASGSPGTSVVLTGLNCGPSQGTKKLVLWETTPYQAVAEATVVQWTNTQITAHVPNAPPKKYYWAVTDGGQMVSGAFIPTFTVN